MLERVYDLYTQLENGRVMMSFKGSLSADLITAILEITEQKMETIEADAKVRKKVFNVVMECLQNLFHHNGTASDQDPGRDEEGHGVVMIAHNDKGYSVLTGNFMRAVEVDALRERLDTINSLGPDELRGLYKETLSNGLFSATGGGGLGMIDIARKSGQKLEYGFVPDVEGSAFFSLNVNVTN